MPNFISPAIVLRRIDYGDYDLILTFFTLKIGKISAIAKSAKKSTKRFGGILELFSVLEVVCSSRMDRDLMILQEADLINSFSGIRADLNKTAYASYFAEMVNEWTELGAKQEELYFLLCHVLKQIDTGCISDEISGILFLIRFASIAGIRPNLLKCSICSLEIDKIKEERIIFDFSRSGIICPKCAGGKSAGRLSLSKGTIKQLLWVENGGLIKAGKMKFTPLAIKEGLDLLEAFTAYHLGKEMQSLKFLKQIRKE
ncbi:MAG: DNA repair protein RecO [Desulfobacteraceae bacterium]|nr:MAG: DNA repair protein RecO [Desulfobacteraceae bacterium]